MAETKPASIGTSLTPTLPRWFAKSQSRYDVDDVAFSPPEDGSAFFSLHFGQAEGSSIASESPHKSTFDKINEELGFAEVSGRKVSVSGSLPRRSSGLCLQAELQVHSQDQRIEEITSAEQKRHTPVKPLLVIPLPSAAASVSTAASPLHDSNSSTATPPGSVLQRCSSNPQTSAAGDGSGSAQLQTKQPQDHDASGDENVSESEHISFGIFEKIRNLVVKKSPPATPAFTPASSPKQLRKAEAVSSSQAIAVPGQCSSEYQNTGGVLVERKMPTYNSFFYRPEREVVAASGTAVASSQTPTTPATANSGAAVQPQLVDGSVAAAAAATVTGKTRRPKPSRLREMNFWAPTSM